MVFPHCPSNIFTYLYCIQNKIMENLTTLLDRLSDDLEYQMNQRTREIQEEKIQKILNGKSFGIEKYYQESDYFKRYGKQNFHGLFEEIGFEDFNTAKMIFDQIRKSGHSIGLKKLVLTVDGKSIKKINFNYIND